jgi:FkbM family methyltransferase
LALRALRRFEFPRKLGLFDWLFGRFLSAHGICWVQTAPGPVWKLDLVNATHRWIVYGHYEGPALWNWLRAQRNAIHTIVDSGANIGQTALYFATLAPQARILAYEPGAAARAWLQECVAFNGFSQIAVHTTGLGASPAPARLVDDGGAGRHGSWNKVNDSQGEPIELVALDDELARLGIESLDLWKLDMEGYEGFALRGAIRAIAAGRIRAIYIETTGETGRENLRLLTTHGYRIHGIGPTGDLVIWNPSHDYENALCLAPGYGEH